MRLGDMRSEVAVVVLAMTLAAMFGRDAHAQGAPDTENGRYTLSPVTDGFLRLNTRNGEVSICTNKNGWTCRLVPDERTALDTEIGRLQGDNKQLREQLAQQGTVTGKTDAPHQVAKAIADQHRRDLLQSLQIARRHQGLPDHRPPPGAHPRRRRTAPRRHPFPGKSTWLDVIASP